MGFLKTYNGVGHSHRLATDLINMVMDQVALGMAPDLFNYVWSERVGRGPRSHLPMEEDLNEIIALIKAPRSTTPNSLQRCINFISSGQQGMIDAVSLSNQTCLQKARSIGCLIHGG